MASEFVNENAFPVDQGKEGERPVGATSERGIGVAVELGHIVLGEEVRQSHEDEAVRTALQRLVGNRLPPERDIHVLLCEQPEAVGIPRARLAAAEEAAYKGAGYGERAEGLIHFAEVFRGYAEHGPLRYVIIAEAGNDENSDELQVLVFGNYFQVSDEFEQLGRVYAMAVEQWKRDNPGLRPEEFIISKLVADPTKPTIAIGLIGLGSEVSVAILRGLASAHQDGILIATRTQRDSQAVVRRLLPRMIPGLQLLLDQPMEGEEGSGTLAMMLGYVPFSSVRER